MVHLFYSIAHELRESKEDLLILMCKNDHNIGSYKISKFQIVKYGLVCIIIIISSTLTINLVLGVLQNALEPDMAVHACETSTLGG